MVISGFSIWIYINNKKEGTSYSERLRNVFCAFYIYEPACLMVSVSLLASTVSRVVT